MINNNHVKDYVSDVFKRYNFENQGRQHFEDCLSAMATIFNMSLRQIEQATALYALAQPTSRINNFLAYAIALKIVNPDLFQRLSKDNDSEAHTKAKKHIEMKQKLNRTSKVAYIYLDPLFDWHDAHINDFNDEMGEGFKNTINNLSRFYRIQKEDIFPFLAAQIDLSIEW